MGAVMSKEKAEACCKRVIECINDAQTSMSDGREALAELHDGKGWAALGYRSWKACLDGEFNEISGRHAYRLIVAAKTDKLLSSDKKLQSVTNGHTLSENVRESHARELKDVQDQHKASVVQKAADSLRGKPVTAASLKAAREALAEKPPAHPWEPTQDQFKAALRQLDALHETIRTLASTKYGGKRLASGGFLCDKGGKPHCPQLAAIRESIKFSAPATCPRCDGKGCPQCGDKGWMPEMTAAGIRRTDKK